MTEKIYFSKVEFREYLSYGLKSILLLNLVEGTLAYQVYDKKINKHAPAITGIKTEEFMGHIWETKVGKPDGFV